MQGDFNEKNQLKNTGVVPFSLKDEYIGLITANPAKRLKVFRVPLSNENPQSIGHFLFSVFRGIEQRFLQVAIGRYLPLPRRNQREGRL